MWTTVGPAVFRRGMLAISLLAAVALGVSADTLGTVRVHGPGEAKTTTGPQPPPGLFTGYQVRWSATPGGGGSSKVIAGVPAYLWRHGCGPTAAGMVLGYWDGNGFPDLVAASAATQTDAVNAMIASEEHYNDYALPLDPYPGPISPDRSEPPVGDEHANNCVGDWMYTSQSAAGLNYGGSWLTDMAPALIAYSQHASSAYTATATMKDFASMPWSEFCAEIDANRPLVLAVDCDGDGNVDHAVTAVGYADTSGQKYGCLNTWDSSVHWFDYAGLAAGRAWGICAAWPFSITSTSTGTPTIALSTSALAPSCAQGSAAGSQTFQVRNAGEGTLSYTISDDVAWLAVSPGSGTSRGEYDPITVTYTTAALGPGTYRGTITVSAAGATNTPQTVAVSLTVTVVPPAIACTPGPLAPACQVGTNAASQSSEVWNAGGGALSYTISDDVSWLWVAPAVGASMGAHGLITVYYATSALAAGSYTAAITISAPGASNSPQTIGVALNVAALPAIARHPGSLTPTCQQGANAASQSFEVWNAGGGTLSYTISGDAAWLSVSPAADSSTGGHRSVTVAYATSGLAVGSYAATISISATGASNSPQTIAVSLAVTARPVIAGTPGALTATCGQGGEASSQTVELWNAGGGTLSYTVSDDVSWLTVSPAAGTATGEHDTLTVSYATAALTTGSYGATITVSGDGATNTPQTVAVSLTVTPPPLIAFSPTLLTATCRQGDQAASQELTVWNAGGGALAYALSSSASWLAVSPAAGTATGEHDRLTVNCATGALTAGTYHGTITIGAPGAANTPQTVAVALTVTPPPPAITSYTVSYAESYSVTPKKVKAGGENVVADVVKGSLLVSGTIKLDASATISGNSVLTIALSQGDSGFAYGFEARLKDFAAYYGAATGSGSGYVAARRQAVTRWVATINGRKVTLELVDCSWDAKARTLKFKLTGAVAQDEQYTAYGTTFVGPQYAGYVDARAPRYRLSSDAATLQFGLDESGVTLDFPLRGTVTGKTYKIKLGTTTDAYWSASVSLSARASGTVK